jgi:hypothetical protein
MRHQLADIHLVAGHREPIPRERRPSVFTRIWARVRGGSLDRALSAGANPAGSAALAQRSVWLTSRRQRRDLAKAVRRLLEPESPRTGMTAAIQPHRGELAAARVPLTWVASMLETDEPIYSPGMARLRLLLRRGDSPLYDADRPGQLAREVEAILEAMEGREETWS